MRKYTLATHPLSQDQQRWLQAIADQPNLPPQNLRVKLRHVLAPNFSPTDIDPRLYTFDAITLLGLWRVEPRHRRVLAVDQIIRDIQRRLEVDPPPTRISSAELAESTGASSEVIGRALHEMGSLGSFFSTAMGSASNPNVTTEITLQGARAYEEYLQYVGLEDLFERLYKSRGLAFEAALSYQSLHPDLVRQHRPSSQPALAVEREKSAFVIMAMNPNQPELTDTYRAIQRACKKVGLEALRIDDIEHAETITARVLVEIEACTYIIADLTHERQNVYYEVGYAHALGKAPILVRKMNSKLHFDLSVHKAPEYKTLSELEEQLEKRLKPLVESASL
jgi:hypothetical protein